MRAVAVFCAFFAFLAGLPAAELEGSVVDPSGAALKEVTVSVWSANQVRLATASTDNAGRFRITGLPPGDLELRCSASGFAEYRQSVRIVAASETGAPLRIALGVQQLEQRITVSAEIGQVESVDAVAQRTNLIPRSLIDERVATVFTEAFREEPGVELQRTGPSMGGVFVRGLTGRNVVLYRDAIRLTTSAQRGGVSTFFNMNDPASVESVEVLRGPNSAQYGSDSLGGTLSLASRTGLAHPPGKPWHQEWSATSSSGAVSGQISTQQSYVGESFSAAFSLDATRVNTARTGGGIDSHAAVTRFLGIPSSVFGVRLPDTAFTQYGGSLHSAWRAAPRHQLIFHYDRAQQDGGKRYDQLLGGDGNLIAGLRNLMFDFGFLRHYWTTGSRWIDSVTSTVSYTAQREERVNQGGQGNPAAAISHQYERNAVWGLNLLASKTFRTGALQAGAEGYRERMRAPGFQVAPASGAVAIVRGRVPDGASYRTYGSFAQASWQPLKTSRLRLGAALRFGGASYRSRAGLSPLVDGRPLWPDDSLAVNAVTGRLSVTAQSTNWLQLHAFYSRGFRAPGMTDLGTLGLQGNGQFEAAFAAVAGPDVFIGTRADDQAISSGRAVARLRPEYTNNIDLGFTVKNQRLRWEMTGFGFDLTNAVVSQTLILPPGAVGRILGDQVVTRQLPTGAVFVPLSTSPVLVRGNLLEARSYGVESKIEAKLSRDWLAGANFTSIRLVDRLNGLAPDIEGGTPPAMAFWRVGYVPEQRGFWAEAYGQIADRQPRLSSLALADRRIGAARSRTNIANFFNNGARVHGLTSGGVLLATGETLSQVQTRVLGAANSAPMFSAIPGYGVFGVRGGIRTARRGQLFLDLSNLFDHNYRGMSWGIDGPGRAVTVRYRIAF
ncbi:MAG: TonB-dependent receptor [Bryobacteraceae bacterium]